MPANTVHVAEIQPGHGIVRPNFDGLAVRGQRACGFAALAVHRAQVIHRHGPPRPDHALLLSQPFQFEDKVPLHIAIVAARQMQGHQGHGLEIG
ncbi:MAG: hypothetical protein Q9P14_08595 [candidate division KSB1 bacterium]|nr:hypothetical protein [candidate division KSB1 bacterium]